MKKFILIIPILLILISCNRKDKVEIKGIINNGEGKELVFLELLVDGTTTINKTKLDQNGSFKFKTETEFPRFYYLMLSKNNFVTLILNPSEKVEITADASDLKNALIKGSKESIQIQALNKRLEETKVKLDSLTKAYITINESGSNKAMLADINQNYAKLVNNLRDSSIAFIIKNLESLASIFVLYQKIDDENFVLYKNRDLQYIKIVSEALAKKYPESPHVKALLEDKDNLFKRYEQLLSQKKVEEYTKTNKVSGLPDIALPDNKGDTISFNTVKARYKLLCFWATWSQESIQRNLDLKPIYEKYHNKGFEIYMVSLDTKEDEWKKSIQFDQLPWINVVDYSGRTSYIAKIYNVRVLPTSYLINSNDDIVSVNPALQEIISTLDYAFK